MEINNRHSHLKPAVAWQLSAGTVAYPYAIERMEARVLAIAADEASELVWLLEHPALYTAGTSARDVDLLSPSRFPVYQTGRGGQYTYHGPGQRVAYVMLDVKRYAGRITADGEATGDVRKFVTLLERWLIVALGELGVHGEARADRVGVWVRRPNLAPDKEDKTRKDDNKRW